MRIYLHSLSEHNCLMLLLLTRITITLRGVKINTLFWPKIQYTDLRRDGKFMWPDLQAAYQNCHHMLVQQSTSPIHESLAFTSARKFSPRQIKWSKRVIYICSKITQTYKNAENATRAHVLLKAYIFRGAVLVLQETKWSFITRTY